MEVSIFRKKQNKLAAISAVNLYGVADDILYFCPQIQWKNQNQYFTNLPTLSMTLFIYNEDVIYRDRSKQV